MLSDDLRLVMDGSSQSDRKKDDNCQSSNKTDMKDDDLVDEELDELLDGSLLNVL